MVRTGPRKLVAATAAVPAVIQGRPTPSAGVPTEDVTGTVTVTGGPGTVGDTATLIVHPPAAP